MSECAEPTAPHMPIHRALSHPHQDDEDDFEDGEEWIPTRDDIDLAQILRGPPLSRSPSPHEAHVPPNHADHSTHAASHASHSLSLSSSAESAVSACMGSASHHVAYENHNRRQKGVSQPLHHDPFVARVCTGAVPHREGRTKSAPAASARTHASSFALQPTHTPATIVGDGGAFGASPSMPRIPNSSPFWLDRAIGSRRREGSMRAPRGTASRAGP